MRIICIKSIISKTKKIKKKACECQKLAVFLPLKISRGAGGEGGGGRGQIWGEWTLNTKIYVNIFC